MNTVRDLLASKPQEVWSISPKAKVIDALKLMSEKEIGALMVLDEKNKPCGIMSERDYARKIALLGRQSSRTLVEEIMTPYRKMHHIGPDDSIEECMVLMTAKHVRHLPVIVGRKLVGIVSLGDVVKALIGEKEDLIEQLNKYIYGSYV